MTLLFLESVGTTELLLILVVALIIFGPRKLPELSRTIGKSLNEFRRASDEFKRTWEREVEMERYQHQREFDRAMLPEDAPAEQTFDAPASGERPEGAPVVVESAGTVARGSTAAPAPAHAERTTAHDAPPTSKSEWV